MPEKERNKQPELLSGACPWLPEFQLRPRSCPCLLLPPAGTWVRRTLLPLYAGPVTAPAAVPADAAAGGSAAAIAAVPAIAVTAATSEASFGGDPDAEGSFAAFAARRIVVNATPAILRGSMAALAVLPNNS